MGKEVTDLDAAFKMLDTFASVATGVAQLKNSLPKLFPGATQRQNNIIVRPHSAKAHLVQLDDLDDAALSRVGDAAFLTLQTSPDNHQAWIAVSGLDNVADAKDYARRLRKGAGADPTASGATRVAGTTNYKRKYGPDFPTVTILQALPGRIMTPEQLEALALIALPEPVKAPAVLPLRVSPHRGERKWPDYQRCVEGAPPNHGKTGPDISRADFVWCMTALTWGHSIEETAAQLMKESSKARENGERYALMTAQNAAAAVERNTQKKGRG